MIRLFKLIFVFTLSIQSFILFGQQSSLKDRLYFEAGVHDGYLMPNVSEVAYFITDHIHGYYFNAGICTDGTKQWQRYYNDPRLGIGFYHSNLGNNQVFGKMNAVYGYFDRYFFKPDSRFNLGNRLSFGLSYVNKKYDLQDNYFDIAIGSKLNVYINYCIEGQVRITPFMQLKMGLGMTHISNGRFKEPNKGLNMITSFASIQYSLKNPTKSIIPKSTEPDETEKNQFIIMLATGEKQISRKYDYSYWPKVLSAEIARKISHTSWIGLALTFYDDPSLQKELELDGDSTKKKDNLRIALNLSYELKMGRFSTVFQPGYYLKNPYTKPGMISNRIGLRYQINQKWLAGVTIKAHWLAIADFIEFGIGYRWHY